MTTTADTLLDNIVAWLYECLTHLELFTEPPTAGDVRSVQARVEAERRILQLWEEPDADWLDLVVIDLAYGHRFDIPGYDEAWVPKWAVTG